MMLVTTLFVISGLIFIRVGWVWLSDPDVAWEWRKRTARRQGFSEQHLERTPEWERETFQVGIFFLFSGGLSFVMALLLWYVYV